MVGGRGVRIAGLLDLGGGGVDGPEVGDRGGHHEHVRVRGVLGHRVAQLAGRADVDDVDAGGVDESGGVAGDQRHIGAALCGDPGHGVALLSRAAVADEPHRVDGLAGAARGDQHLDPGQVIGQRIAAGQQELGQRGDLLGLGQPAGTAVRAGEPARRRFEDDGAAAAQSGDVFDGGRVQPHLGVHGGREQHRTTRGQQRRGQQVIGAPGDGAGQQVGGGRSDDHQIGLLADAHVRHLVDVVEDAGVHGLAGERLEGGGPDEPQRGLGWGRRGRRGRPR